MKILLIDNYDSFTYNLVHLLKESFLEFSLDVKRNDEVNTQESLAYDALLLSPGPGIPSEAGNMPSILKACATTKPILGICLGHQAIGELFGAQLINLPEVFHGVAMPTKLLDTSNILFQHVPEEFITCRYHSWAVKRNDLPEELRVIAEDENGIIMALSHQTLPIYGLQFHPESVMTEYGKRIIENWLNSIQKI
ncbi:MAG: anthranilate synthase component II [Flavobacteriales bacterium]